MTALRLVAWLSALPAFLVAAERPDVIFMAIDDLRPALGCYGDPHARTPHLDRLAARGLVFERAYCQVAKCGPSRLSVLSGLGPDTVGVEGHGEKELASFRERHGHLPNLPRHFKEHGYHARGFGKVQHDGWDEPRDWSAPLVAGREGEMLEIADLEALTNLPYEERSQVPTLIAPRDDCPVLQDPEVPDETFFDARMTSLALEVLNAPREEPLFLAIGYRRPHLPFVAPRRYFDLHQPRADWLPGHRQPAEGAPLMAWFNSDAYGGMVKRLGLDLAFPPEGEEEALRWNGFELRSYAGVPKDGPLSDELQLRLRQGYYACVSYVDAQIGRLLDALDREDRWGSTIFVVWSDHGWHLGEHGAWSKMTNYEVATRVPLIVAAPGMAGGARTDSLAELIDLYPTLCGLAGLPVPAHCEGTSLAPVLRDPATTVRDAARSQFPRFKTRLGRALRTDRHRYVEWTDKRTGEVVARELYDHEVDPEETRNLAESRTDVVEALSKRLATRP